ncbi:AraC family transcriptional regulator [Dyadobacter sp. LJ53]|uniref:helix-turn-helix domain-containing protein n=1 Tax=Dyadobacter chenwenxiniae TaxID=2906456 RepID=UPI001F487965|nr:AraC family transcriptional regulator [Dyadobacter chenwenxiniae]MCF0049337.1 AraC family transcriptional regulator [Dyadobacter chenwenxiniae]
MANKIKSYGFFNYSVNEALILSDDEQSSLETIFGQLQKEINLPIDTFSQDVILSHLDLLLTYGNRYYNRQFITRKATRNELLNRMEYLLDEYFSKRTSEKGVPTVSQLASLLNLSPKYLSDCLKQLTGQTALQHIHEKLIDKAKEQLASTELSVSEIAYHFGFEFPQSFSKLFKSKNRQTPLEYRQSVN